MEQTRPNALAALKANPASPTKPRPRTVLIAGVCAALGIGGAVSPAARRRKIPGDQAWGNFQGAR